MATLEKKAANRCPTETPSWSLSGGLMIVVVLALLAAALWLGSLGDPSRPESAYGVGVALLALTALFITFGFFVVKPNHTKVILLFGRYLGTARENGWFWTNPFTVGQRLLVSLRIRNFQSEKLKVNDAAGNPIEIAAVVVWRVVDTARATFDVEAYSEFVHVQSETAVRALATHYPYDTGEDDSQMSLRGNIDEISHALQQQLQARLEPAGVEVLETRLSHLAYAPEIAGAMLRRQQANAIVAARRRIVEGAVGMVEHALSALNSQGIVELDEEKKAAMVSNLLVVLTSEHAAQPVINTGTLYP